MDEEVIEILEVEPIHFSDDNFDQEVEEIVELIRESADYLREG